MKLALVVVVLAAIAFAFPPAATAPGPPPEKKDMTGGSKLEQVMTGHLTDLNGKYKLRVAENDFAPGGWIGDHQHVGPGIRYVATGELSFTEGGNTKVYHQGDYYFESGDKTHHAKNTGTVPTKIISFEIVPADYKGGSAYQPKK
jgi:quercetin dioxygenase-like cupin family protein